MPIEKTTTPDIEPPKEPHLVVINNQETKEGWAIATPALMAIVTDPTDPNGVFPFVLTKVSERQFKGICACGQKKCTAKFTWTIKVEGHHPRFTK